VQVQTVSANHVGVEIVTMNLSRGEIWRSERGAC
jgi:hypothetical protein